MKTVGISGLCLFALMFGHVFYNPDRAFSMAEVETDHVKQVRVAKYTQCILNMHNKLDPQLIVECGHLQKHEMPACVKSFRDRLCGTLDTAKHGNK